jgi:hypothetical protein
LICTALTMLFALGGGAGSASASYGSAQGPALPASAPFQQCPAIYKDASCGYLIDITGGVQPTVLVDPSVGFYEGEDDVLVGVQNDSSLAVGSLHIGVPGSGSNSFAFDNDGMCNREGVGGVPVPGECPFGPNVGPPYGYWGPDAELSAASLDDGSVTFPVPLQPGQYTYFALEAAPGSVVVAGSRNDLIVTALSGGGTFGQAHLSSPAPVDVTDKATLKGPHAAEAAVGKHVTYRLYSDSSCSNEILAGGLPAGGEKTIAEAGKLPESSPYGAELPNNAVYYWRAEYEGDSQNDAVRGNCGDETMTFGTPPAPPQATVTTNLTGSNGASGAQITVPQGTAVSDTASVSLGGVPQSGRVSYYAFSDPGCGSQVAGARLGGATSATGAYGASTAVVLPLGTYYFQVLYSGNAAVAPSRSACAAEVLHVVPAPAPVSCGCSSIRAFLNRVASFGPRSTRLQMRLNVALACTGGIGSGCRGEVRIRAPKGAKFIDTGRHPRGVRGFRPTATLGVKCAGPCAGTTIQRATLSWLALETRTRKRGGRTYRTTVPLASFLGRARHVHPETVLLETICHAAGGAVVQKRMSLTIRFDAHGQVDYRRSDLNGDRRPDGRRLAEF